MFPIPMIQSEAFVFNYHLWLVEQKLKEEGN